MPRLKILFSLVWVIVLFRYTILYNFFFTKLQRGNGNKEFTSRSKLIE